MKPLHVGQSMQAGDTFLLRFNCPHCAQEQLQGFPLKECPDCGIDLSNQHVELPGRKDQILLCGSRRKRRIGKRLIQTMLAAQDKRCAYCIQPFSENIEVEHIIPLAVGGTNHPRNLCLSCPRCNRIAGSLAFPTFGQKRAYILFQLGVA